MTAAAGWWLCPNNPPCEHGAVLHDRDDDESTCCVEGCTCGHIYGPSDG